MRRLFALLALTVLALGVSSCVPLLHEAITEDMAVFEPGLVGTWSSDDDLTLMKRLAADATPSDEFWVIEKSGDKGYTATLHYVDDPERHEPDIFNMRFTRLPSGAYLDLMPAPWEGLNDSEFRDFFLVRAHCVFRVSLNADSMTVLPLNPDWLRERFKAGSVRLPHEDSDDGLVITASSKQLRRFLERHGDDPGAFAQVN